MKTKFILFFLMFLVSCTTTKLNENQISKEFGGAVFKLDRPMYLIFYFECGLFGRIQEVRTPVIEFVEFISIENVANFQSDKNYDVGDNGCSYDKDIRVYNLLGESKELEIVSIKDVLNASWWFWEIKGNVEINGKFRSFRMELPYQEDVSLRDALSEVFVIPK